MAFLFSFLFWKGMVSRMPTPILQLVKTLQEKGHGAWVVGGALRQLGLGEEPEDWDLATDARPQDIEEYFEHTVPLGREFGTIQVRAGSMKCEVTTLRGPGGEGSLRAQLKEDLALRDFTINAMAYDPLSKRGYDPFGGRRDLIRRLVRAVGEAEARFREDPLRKLRFYRFQASLDFKGERKTEQAVDASLLSEVSDERLGEEMTRLLVAPSVARGMTGLVKSGILTFICPEFNCLQGQGEVMDHLIATLQAISPQPHLRWAALLHDLGKGKTRFYDQRGVHYYGHEEVSCELGAAIMARLKLPGELKEKVLSLVRWHMFPADPAMNDAALRRLVKRVGEENIKDLLELRRADIIASTPAFHRAWNHYSSFARRLQGVLEEKPPYTHSRLAIDGHDVMEIMELERGPEVGEVLERAVEWVLEDTGRNTREQLISFLLELKKG